MASMMKPGIILLKQGTDTSQGIPQIVSNINACQAVVDTVKTTLGPRGMDKLIVNGRSTTISNDGATIINKLDFVHPAAKIMVDIAQAQDDEIGDGTTSVVILAGELMKKAKTFIEDGIDPRKIASSYNKACQLAVERIRQLQVNLDTDKPEKLDAILHTCADTALNSKLVNNYKHVFTPMVVKAVKHLDDYLPLNMIGVKKIQGGTMEDSKLILGVAFKKAFSYAGFEMQPKKYIHPKIAILNIELELKAEKENAELRIKSIEEYQKIVDAEWDILYSKLDKIVKSGAKVVLSRLPIGDVATQYFADRDVFCAGRITDEDLKRTVKACGGTIQTMLEDNIKLEYLGSCDLFEEVQIGNERYNIFTGCPQSKTCTFLLRGCGEQYLDEVHRSLHDAIMIVRRTIKKNSVVAGGGAVEMELSKHLRQHSLTIAGKEQLFISAFAMALEVIPRQLCLNAGLDVPSIMNPLRHKHSLADGSGVWFGVDLTNETITDNYIASVWEPAVSKINSIISATEAATLILTVDETISAKSRDH